PGADRRRAGSARRGRRGVDQLRRQHGRDHAGRRRAGRTGYLAARHRPPVAHAVGPGHRAGGGRSDRTGGTRERGAAERRRDERSGGDHRGRGARRAVGATRARDRLRHPVSVRPGPRLPAGSEPHLDGRPARPGVLNGRVRPARPRTSVRAPNRSERGVRMARELTLPELAESVVEGEIVRWLVQEGESVALDQPVVEVMTDKVTVELPSPFAGVLEKHLVAEGDVVAVHAPIATFADEGTSAATTAAAGAAASTSATSSGRDGAAKPVGVQAAEERSIVESGAVADEDDGESLS